jgi:LCP family protein required for cell wall assembly
VLAAVLAVTALVVPPSGVREGAAVLVRVQRAQAVDAVGSPDVLWLLALGSDARPGQPVLRSRADAIQLVGVNLRTGAATAIGVPRDSYVDVPGHGRNKINSALMYGGPQLMARAVGAMVGIRPDYVLTTDFPGIIRMVNAIGGVTVRSKYAFTDPVKHYRVGRNQLNGLQAMVFARIRKSLPHGDFDRSANQQRLIIGILRKVRANADEPGFMERALASVARNLRTELRPSELFVLAQALTGIEPARFRHCVISGGVGYVGAASVVFPDLGQARSIARRVRDDATLHGPCS